MAQSRPVGEEVADPLLALLGLLFLLPLAELAAPDLLPQVSRAECVVQQLIRNEGLVVLWVRTLQRLVRVLLVLLQKAD
jgi:hypothetical protein